MPTIAVSQKVLNLLGTNALYRPFDLLNELRNQGLEDSDIKEAVAYLLNDHQIEMTPDRQIRISTAAVHA